MITQKTLRGNRTPKSYILSGVRSSNGKRLDQDINRNLGAELAKLSREKSELQQGLGGGNTMATYKLKRFSNTTPKSYTLKRKTFGFLEPVADVANNAINTGVGVAKNVGGTAMEVGGKAVSAAGKVAKPFAGIGGTVLGAMKGAAMFGPLGAIGGAILGNKVGKGAADLTKSVGETLQDGGMDLKTT